MQSHPLPAISTVFAIACSQGTITLPNGGLSSNSLGMSKEAVTKIIGAPDNTESWDRGDVVYRYGKDVIGWRSPSSLPDEVIQPERTSVFFDEDGTASIMYSPARTLWGGLRWSWGNDYTVGDLPRWMHRKQAHLDSYDTGVAGMAKCITAIWPSETVVHTISACPRWIKVFDPSTDRYSFVWTNELNEYGIGVVKIRDAKLTTDSEDWPSWPMGKLQSLEVEIFSDASDGPAE